MPRRLTRSYIPRDSKDLFKQKPPNNKPVNSIITKMRTCDDHLTFTIELNKLLDRNNTLCKENCQLKRSLRAKNRELLQIRRRISKLENRDENCSPSSVNNGKQQHSSKRMRTRACKKVKEESDEGYDGWSSDDHGMMMDVTVLLTRMTPEELQRYSAPDEKSNSVRKPCIPVQKPSKSVLKERPSNDQWSSTFLKHDFFLSRFLNVM